MPSLRPLQFPTPRRLQHSHTATAADPHTATAANPHTATASNPCTAAAGVSPADRPSPHMLPCCSSFTHTLPSPTHAALLHTRCHLPHTLPSLTQAALLCLPDVPPGRQGPRHCAQGGPRMHRHAQVHVQPASAHRAPAGPHGSGLSCRDCQGHRKGAGGAPRHTGESSAEGEGESRRVARDALVAGLGPSAPSHTHTHTHHHHHHHHLTPSATRSLRWLLTPSARTHAHAPP
eukprot:74497-Chlamydomonas_euryale.AAC.3